jgi:hypothetical protein
MQSDDGLVEREERRELNPATARPIDVSILSLVAALAGVRCSLAGLVRVDYQEQDQPRKGSRSVTPLPRPARHASPQMVICITLSV